MFNLIDIGERAGSGVPDIFNVWEDAGFETPEIIEESDPDRTRLLLSFEKKETQAIKASDKKQAIKISDGNQAINISDEAQAIKASDKKHAIKTTESMARIVEYLRESKEAGIAAISRQIGLSPARTRAIISQMEEVEFLGGNRNRTYRLKS